MQCKTHLLVLVFEATSTSTFLGDREGGARLDHHVLSQEAKADVALPRLMPGLSIHMDFFVRSLGPLCTQLWIFVNFSPVCLFSVGRKQRDRQGHTDPNQVKYKLFCSFTAETLFSWKA